MTDGLLDRQSRLLAYLTSGAAIFGDAPDAFQNLAAPGVDPALLRLEASFCYEKRMAKIAVIFPRTIELLGSERDMIMREFAEIYAVPHVMTEVSNLTDLHGVEKAVARETLKRLIHSVVEPEVSSVTASVNLLFRELGLTDAAIAEIALAHDCTVLTDDLPLYLWLTTMKISAINFTHVRERLGIF